LTEGEEKQNKDILNYADGYCNFNNSVLLYFHHEEICLKLSVKSTPGGLRAKEDVT